MTTVFFVPVAFAQSSQDKWQGHIEAEGKWGTERSLGEIGVFLPLWQDEDALIFTDIRGRFDDQSSSEGNFGAGIRYKIDDESIIGFYAFYDHRRTENDNIFHQATLGFEALTEDLEFRLNGYIPESDEATVNSGSTSVTGAVSAGGFQLVTTTTGDMVERALPGLDVEAGYQFDVPGHWEFWAYGGGFHFDADGYDNVSGPRGRLELSYNDVPYLGEGSKFTLGFETQTDNVRGGQSWGVARIRIPLNYSKAQKPSALSALDNRMTTRINRDVDIVSAQGGDTPATVSVETASATTASGQTVNDYTPVVAGGDITTAVANAGAGALVVLDGTGGAINTATQVNLAANQTIMSGGQTLTLTGTQSGRIFTATLPGTRATVHYTGGGNGFNTNTNNTLQGFDITATGGIGILVNASDIEVRNITIDGSAIGIDLTNNASNAVIEDVSISNASANGLRINQSTNTAISDVTITAADTGIYFDGGVTSTVSLGNVTIDQSATAGVSIPAISTVNGLSGFITTTNTATPCLGGGAAPGSTLQVDGALCP